jgi:hypothetical protein
MPEGQPESPRASTPRPRRTGSFAKQKERFERDLRMGDSVVRTVAFDLTDG